MSILKSTADDFVGGRPLPNAEYRATVVQAQVEQTENGKRLTRMYGNLRTREGATELALPDGSTFRIGARKLFARSWIEHSNEQAQSIGTREIKREAVSAGLMPKPAKGETVELPFDSWEEYANALTGREVIVRTQLKPKGVNKLSTPEEKAKAEKEAQIVAWLES